MKPAPTPLDEERRLAALRALDLLDTPAEERFDRITRLAQSLFDVPIALVSIIDKDRQWFKSRRGLDAPQTPRDVSFCGHAIMGDALFVVPDATRDGRFSDNPLVTGAPNVVFYAGAPLSGPGGQKVGTLCLIDHKPRDLTPQQRQVLADLARIVESEIAATAAKRAPAVRVDRLAGKGRRAAIGGVGLALFAFLAVSGYAIHQRAKLAEDNAWVAHTHDVMDSLERILSTGRSLEGASRGYAITGDASYLSRFESDAAAMSSSVETFRRLTADNPRQSARAGELARLAGDRAAASRRLIAARDAKGREAALALVKAGAGKRAMEALRATVVELEGVERGLLRERAGRVADRSRTELVVLLFAALLGLILAMLAASEAVSDLKARAELQARMEDALVQLQSILDSVAEGVVVADPQGRFLVFNPAAEAILGAGKLQSDPAEWSRLYSLYKEDGTPFPAEEIPLARALNGERTKDVEMIVRRKGREDTVISVSGAPLTGTDGTKLGGVVVFGDATERKRAARELERARDIAVRAAKFRSDFLANMSHELRTPLNAVIGMTGLLADTGLDARQKQYLDTIRSAGEALLTLISDILDLSKIEAGKMTMETIDFDLRDTVEEAVELVAQRAHAKGLVLAVSVPPEAPTAVRGDPGRLRQVLLNLLGNAVKFTEKGEVVVTVDARTEGERVAVRVAVRDTGIGLSETGRRLLFQAFTQADASTTRKYGGTGLGLAISKQLVELMGGTIGVDSEEGKGSEFWFTASFVPGAGKADRGRVDDLAGLRFLIVDDNATNRLITQTQAMAWGLEPKAAATGAEALAELRAAALAGRPFQAALLDLRMPDMDGPALARAIRADKLLDACRLILASSGETPSDSGVFSAVLMKPVRRSMLLDSLLDALAKKPRARPAHGAAKPAPARSRGRRVLVVEDNAVNQMIVKLQLEKLGTPCDVAGSGEEALKMVAAANYAIVFMDCQMPGLDGYETTARLRASEKDGVRRPVVAMTANALAGDREKCLAAGMDDYVAKPVRVEELSAALAKWDPSVDPRVAADLKAMGGDEAFAAILAEYSATGLAAAEAVEAAAAAGDKEKAKASAHALKGSSGSVGAMRLHDMCGAVEAAAKNDGDWRTPAGGLAEEFRRSLAEIKGEAGAAPAAAPKGAAAHGRFHVLVVDDDAAQRRITGLRLSKLGCEVEEAPGGKEALARVAEGGVSLVLLNLGMPGMDGYETAAALARAEEGRPRTPVIGMSATAGPNERQRAVAAGMLELLQKPLTDENLARLAGLFDSALRDSDLAELRAVAKPDQFKKLMDDFIRHSREHVAELEAAAKAADVKAVLRLCHLLRGSASTFGARGLATLCANAEAAADAGKSDEYSRLVAQMGPEIDRIQRAAQKGESSQ